MLYCYIHNPGQPIRKIQHIPITAAGIQTVVRTAGKNILMKSHRDGTLELNKPGY